MESLNLINYDTETDMVKLLPSSKNFYFYVENTKKGDIPWNKFFFGLATIFLVGSISIYTGLIRFVTSFQWVFFMLAIFLVGSIAYHRNVKKF